LGGEGREEIKKAEPFLTLPVNQRKYQFMSGLGLTISSVNHNRLWNGLDALCKAAKHKNW